MEYFFQSCNTIEELTANVDLGTLSAAATDGTLQRWLEEHFCDEQARAIDIARLRALNDDELRLALCEELSIDLMSLSDYDTRAIERALARRRKKIMYIDFDAGEPDGAIAEDQNQLTALLNRNVDKVIYLCGGEFQIPLSRRSMTYIGRDGAIVDIERRGRVNFDAAGIVFKNLTLYLKYITPDKISIDNSVNVKFVLGNCIALDETIRPHEVLAFLQGRGAFETFAEFSSRADKMRGIVIGEVALNPSDFDITRNIFELHPRWRIEFLKALRKFARDKYFSIFVDVDSARSIFDNERKQLIYADFGIDGSDAAIRVMFLQTQTRGRILIMLTDKPPAQAIGGTDHTSGSGGAGYGLELIRAFKDDVRA